MTRRLRPLDLDTVQAFVLTAELGSFTRAAEALETTQSAISLKLRRLEERLECRLLERTPRHVRLSPQGESFLPAARALMGAHDQALSGLAPEPPRRLVLGISDHVAGPELPSLVAQLAAQDPQLMLEIRICASRELQVGAAAGGFDAVIFRREADNAEGTALAQERLGWFAAPSWRMRPGEPVRLATLAAPCGVRATATRALDEAGLAWTEVFVGGGVMAVGAAVTAGLAVAALARRVAPPGALEVGGEFGLPRLPVSQIMMQSRSVGVREQEALRIVSAAFRSAIGR
jgi:DNA-binding transcriptional LysR family regulator